MTSGEAQHRPALTTHRGLACLAVIAAHAGAWDGGWVGVPVFLAQSGYLGAVLLEQGSADWLVRRASRILPLALLVAALAVALDLVGETPVWAVMVGLVWPWADEVRHGPVGVLWSLHLEGLWYLTAPSLTVRPALMLGALAMALAAGPLGLVGYLHPVGQCAAVLLGALAATYRHALPSAALRGTMWSLGILGALVATIGGHWWLAAPLCGAAAAASCVLAWRGKLGKVPGSSAWQWLGTRCLGVYLLHMWCLLLLPDLVGLALVPVVAELSWRYVEQPARAALLTAWAGRPWVWGAL